MSNSKKQVLVAVCLTGSALLGALLGSGPRKVRAQVVAQPPTICSVLNYPTPSTVVFSVPGTTQTFTLSLPQPVPAMWFENTCAGLEANVGTEEALPPAGQAITPTPPTAVATAPSYATQFQSDFNTLREYQTLITYGAIQNTDSNYTSQLQKVQGEVSANETNLVGGNYVPVR